MALYEHVFLVRQDASATQVEALTEQFKTIISDNGGTVGKSEYWGLRSMPYRMKKNRKAHYSLMNIDAPHPAVAEMERQMRINEDVIRHLTLRVDEHEAEPSAMMRSRGGRDRDDRKPGFGNRDDRPGRGRSDDRGRGDDRGRDRDGGAPNKPSAETTAGTPENAT